MTDGGLEDLWRDDVPQVLAALVRRYGDFDRVEDAVQEALLAASLQWPAEGTPANPAGWLVRVASRRLVDRLRSDQSRAQRERAVALMAPDDSAVATFDDAPVPVHDDTVVLMVLCCHPALSRGSQVALTLRAVGGLTTAKIASAFLVPEATMAQRISRAKARLRDTGAGFWLPSADETPGRLAAVLDVLYLIFTEGHTVSDGSQLYDVSLTDEAIRLTRQIRAQRPDDGEVAGLLALMLLTDARRDARIGSDGALVPLEQQDRRRWRRCAIDEGVRLLESTLPQGQVGPLQLQAAIAAVHDEATSWAETDWAQIVILYRMLAKLDPSPTVRLNQAVAMAMLHGPRAGLRMVDDLLDHKQLRHSHRPHAVRAHLLQMAGDLAGARSEYAVAARMTTSLPEQRYLQQRHAALDT